MCKLLSECKKIQFWLVISVEAILLSSLPLVAVRADSVEFLATGNSAEESIAERVSSAFSQATSIVVKYLPNANMGLPPTRKEEVEERWRYMFAYKCPASCVDNATKIQRYFSAGITRIESCPNPYFAVVELNDNKGVISKFYIHQSGQCFTLGRDSFFVEYSFSKFVESSKLYPDFVKQL